MAAQGLVSRMLVRAAVDMGLVPMLVIAPVPFGMIVSGVCIGNGGGWSCVTPLSTLCLAAATMISQRDRPRKDDQLARMQEHQILMKALSASSTTPHSDRMGGEASVGRGLIRAAEDVIKGRRG